MKYANTGQGKRKAPKDSDDGGKATDGHTHGHWNKKVHPLDTSSAGGEMKKGDVRKSGMTGTAGGYKGEDT